MSRWNQRHESRLNGNTVLISRDDLLEIVKTAIREEVEEMGLSGGGIDQPGVWMDSASTLEYLHISRPTLSRWQNEGLIPYAKVGGKCLYNRDDIDAALRGTKYERADT